MSILNEILKNKREELQAVKSSFPLAELKARIKDVDATISFKTAIKKSKNTPLKLIAELKKASPSKGLIRKDFNLSEIVSAYNKRMSPLYRYSLRSVFSGKLDYLNKARKRTSKPLLRKDFISTVIRFMNQRANNADAILLIVAALEKSQLSDLYELSKGMDLDCLVEVHDWKELDTALYCGAEIIGINNRDLKTLNISLRNILNYWMFRTTGLW
jgi:indole-3-glycerol phosphate synthase